MNNELTEAEWLLLRASITLRAIVPDNQNDMVDWAVKSQDAVYTRAGAAYYTLSDYVKHYDFNFLPIEYPPLNRCIDITKVIP